MHYGCMAATLCLTPMTPERVPIDASRRAENCGTTLVLQLGREVLEKRSQTLVSSPGGLLKVNPDFSYWGAMDAPI